MSNKEFFKSARLYTEDKTTGEQGFNLVAIMLLGSDDLILDTCPAYMTDAIFRRTDPDRYDDRDIVQTNLIESVDRLMAFGVKHLPDPFFLNEKAERISIRDIIIREMIVNMLIHREFASAKRSRFVIEPRRIYTENPCRAARHGKITLENLEPDPKNPIIAAFFRAIGLADELGSGVRKMFKYGKSFAGNDPELTEGDIFRDEFELNSELFNNGIDEESGRYESTKGKDVLISATAHGGINGGINGGIKNAIAAKPGMDVAQLVAVLGKSRRTVERAIAKLKQLGEIEYRGSKKTGGYFLK